jgi:SAM-dependent methyltransferase
MTEINLSKNHARAYKEQYWYAENFVEGFLNIDSSSKLNILEIGTAEAGLLKYFHEKGHNCYGIEYSPVRHNNSIELNEGFRDNLFHGDITDVNTYSAIAGIQFDIIILRDVIEHVKDQKLALQNIYNLLKAGGKFFVSFPPKHSPYAGHQQVFPKKLGKLPYIYMLPDFLYRKIILYTGFTQKSVDYYLFLKRNRISIRKFLKLTFALNYKLIKTENYFFRPCYEYRFNMKRLINPFSAIPIVNEFTTLGSIYWLSK